MLRSVASIVSASLLLVALVSLAWAQPSAPPAARGTGLPPGASAAPAPGPTLKPEAAQLLAQLSAKDAPPNALWLDSLDVSLGLSAWNAPQAGKSVAGNPLKLRGVTYPHGVGTHAVSKFLVDLKGAATRFACLAGVDDAADNVARCGFEVWVDDKQVFQTKPLTKKDLPQLIDVDLKGAKKLLLVVNDGGNGPDWDHADWAGALLFLDPAAKEKPVAIEAPDGCLPEPPKQPGYHNVRFSKFVFNGKPYRAKYSVFVPRSYAQDPTAKLPLILFLHGAGECGPNVDLLAVHGPPMFSRNDKNWQEKSPFMVLSPQLHGQFGWADTAGAQFAVAALDEVSKHFPVDPDRIYVTGLSLGGIGSWRAAEAFPDRFAGIAPLCARQLDPIEQTAQKIRHVPVWVACGDNDGPFTEGTRNMLRVLRRLDAPYVRFTAFPDGTHGIWVDMYSHRELYDWFLSNVRGKPAPRAASGLPPWNPVPTVNSDPFSPGAFAADLGKFAPGWTAADLGALPADPELRPGLRPEWKGKKNVLVTVPADIKTPCRLTKAVPVPSAGAKKTVLHLVVGRHPAGEWQLTVKADAAVLLDKRIDRASAGKLWFTADVDLSKFAGKTVQLQLLNGATGWVYDAAYFAEVKLVTE